jgi:hypothetical protein
VPAARCCGGGGRTGGDPAGPHRPDGEVTAPSEPRCEHDPASRGCCRWRSSPVRCRPRAQLAGAEYAHKGAREAPIRRNLAEIAVALFLYINGPGSYGYASLPPGAGIVDADRTVYVGSGDGNLYAIKQVAGVAGLAGRM